MRFLIVIVGVFIIMMVGCCQGTCPCFAHTDCLECVAQTITPRRSGRTNCVFIKTIGGIFKCTSFVYWKDRLHEANEAADCNGALCQVNCQCSPITDCLKCVKEPIAKTKEGLSRCVFVSTGSGRGECRNAVDKTVPHAKNEGECKAILCDDECECNKAPDCRECVSKSIAGGGGKFCVYNRQTSKCTAIESSATSTTC